MTDNKPSRTEDEYFVKMDAALIKEQRARLDAERAAAERKSHYGKCPRCGGTLAEAEYHHVRIDRCPDCRGVWLDKGELELLAHIDQSNIREFVRAMFGLKW
jgi:RNA polymerase-binding transcription factor DksA